MSFPESHVLHYDVNSQHSHTVQNAHRATARVDRSRVSRVSTERLTNRRFETRHLRRSPRLPKSPLGPHLCCAGVEHDGHKGRHGFMNQAVHMGVFCFNMTKEAVTSRTTCARPPAPDCPSHLPCMTSTPHVDCGGQPPASILVMSL